MKKCLSIPLGIIICLLIGFLSRLLHETAMEMWYPFLEKSALNPPDNVFPIVWGVIYVMMGISLGILMNIDSTKKKALPWLFAIQLLLNISWNYLFFYLQMLGLINLIILDVLAIIFYFEALKIKRSVAYFFLPYSIWILFATYLNLYIAMYN